MARTLKVLLIVMIALFIGHSEAEAKHRGLHNWRGYSSGFRGFSRGHNYRQPVYRNYRYDGINRGRGYYVPYNYSYGGGLYSDGYYPYAAPGVNGNWNFGY